MTLYYLQIIDNIVVGYATSMDVFPDDTTVVMHYSLQEPIDKLGKPYTWV